MLMIFKKCFSGQITSPLMSGNSAVGNLKIFFFFSAHRRVSDTIIIIVVLFEMKRDGYLTSITNF